jgi:small subunit ribosomal protein S27
MELYSCLKFIINSCDWEDLKMNTEEKDNDEEETRVCVHFLRNPHFDNHFDLQIGIIWWVRPPISKTGNTIKGSSFKTIGLAYYNLWNELSDHLEILKGPVYSETVELVISVIDKRALENSENLKDTIPRLKLKKRNTTSEKGMIY